jgi:DNA-directed RNA polymerase subunit alpha
MANSVTRVPLNRAFELEEQRKRLLITAIAELGLDVRTTNGLEAIGVLYVNELVLLTRDDLMSIPNFGKKSVDRIVNLLAENGLSISPQRA